MIQTIVTPIDGSRHAQLALDMSTDLAARYDAQLILLHVGYRDGSVPKELYDTAARELGAADGDGGETAATPTQSRELEILEHMGLMLLRNAQRQAEDKGVKRVETVMEAGDPGDRILHHAKQWAADLIVMGSRGFGELKGLVLGSVSHKVHNLAPCSCITVHSTNGQAGLEGINSILVPTDGSGTADKAVELASDIAGKYGAKLVLLYVMWRGPSLAQLRASVELDQLSEGAREDLDPAAHPIAEHVSSTFMPPVVPMDTQKEIGQQVLERARRTAEARGARAPKLVMREGDPARTIANLARREQADLIAMGSRGLGGAEGLLLGSVSYKVSHTAHSNCMIVR